ncbi:hypothetical protein ATK36_0964 [Amycolatopsis sulphurea]|uniref:Uncharacterized protein n=1 Tax=Amycolatopsis sulphurea TaxID=76022 RepID=A0A2A9G2K7_9PSEU|nr:hypothetical protein [Amycolatopsis sulphurea]PFG57383.1 hypothetical protein ATK36_0964 [Amycolatopsis sulphurea]
MRETAESGSSFVRSSRDLRARVALPTAVLSAGIVAGLRAWLDGSGEG